MFQFQTGSIKSVARKFNLGSQRSFNSKLVRLEDDADDIIYRISTRFQFQTGSIRSVKIGEALGNKEIMFQFQTGSIRRLSEYCINIILDPYSSCQVNFYFNQIREQSAVDL